MSASPQVGGIWRLCGFLTVLSCPVLSYFFGHAPRSNCWTCFCLLWLKRRVSEQASAFRGFEHRWRWRHMEKICPQNSPKVVVDRQFQAKMQKYENCSISKNVNPIKPKFEDKTETITCTSWVGYHYPKPNPIWLRPQSLKLLWRRNSAADYPIPMKFGVLMENDMPMTLWVWWDILCEFCLQFIPLFNSEGILKIG